MENIATSEEPPNQDFMAEPPENANVIEDLDWNKEPDSNNSRTTQLSDRLDQNREPGKKAITVEHNSQGLSAPDSDSIHIDLTPHSTSYETGSILDQSTSIVSAL